MRNLHRQVQATSEDSIKRLHSLSDNIFALVMTLTVVFIRIPSDDMESTESAIRAYLLGQAETVTMIMVNFLLVALYWFVNHEQAKYIRNTDVKYTWATLVYLLFLVVLPFPNALSMHFSASLTISVLCSLNIILVGVLSYVRWAYATNNHRLVSPDLELSTIDRIKRETIVEPCVALLSIPVAYISPKLWPATFLLIPPIMSAIKRRSWAIQADLKG